MKKIVLNCDYGGIGFSEKAIEKLIGMGFFPEDYSSAENFRIDGVDWSPTKKDRMDPRVIQVVEELGKEANGEYACLVIKEFDEENFLPCIHEYDGDESLQLVPIVNLDQLMSLI